MLEHLARESILTREERAKQASPELTSTCYEVSDGFMVPREAEDWPLLEDMGQRTGQVESSVLGRVAVHRIDVGGFPPSILFV